MTTKHQSECEIRDDARVLSELAEADGAILMWQVSSMARGWFVSACERDVIRYDEATDCYVHPGAVRCVGGGFSMNPAE